MDRATVVIATLLVMGSVVEAQSQPDTLLAVSENQLVVLDVAGQPQWTVPLPASQVRILTHELLDEVLVLADSTLWAVQPGVDGSLRQVAVIPAEVAEGLLLNSTVEGLQSLSDWGIEEGAQAVCLRLLDRNENMASFGYSVRIDLGEGMVSYARTMDIEDDSHEEPNPCAYPLARMRLRAPDTPRASIRVSIDETSCSLSIAGGLVDTDLTRGGTWFCDDIVVEGVSRSGRYVLLSQFADSSDYIYRSLAVFDAQLGAWVDNLNATLVGESLIQWSRTQDAVIIDSTLWLLGDSAVAVAVPEWTVWRE